LAERVEPYIHILGHAGRHVVSNLRSTGAGDGIMIIDLSGKTAVISGSTAGIGYAIARGLARAGAGVVLNGRTEERTRDAAARLGSEVAGAQVTPVSADVANARGLQRFMDQVPDADILVNNVGIFEPKPFLEIADADWERVFQVNVMSGVRLTRFYLPGMILRGWGRIVFISSESGVQIPAEMVHYGMTKTAQLAISRGIAESVAGTGVTVNAVLPGPTRSEGVEAFLSSMAAAQDRPRDQFESEFIETQRPSSLIRRLAEVDEVANMVVYVCSEQASATTGAALRVDGGVVRSVV
jgi:NAD(P)-dependent dehydrogenase (short-subunit alcohol dehydrogenase family)